MKILAFVDLHGNLGALDRIISKAKNCDLLVCAGDLTTFEQNIEYMLYKLDRIKKPILIVPGNHESDSAIRLLGKSFKNTVYLEKTHYENGGYLFVGCSGNGFARKDDDFEEFARKLERTISNRKESTKLILVVHAPPYRTRLDMIYKGHNGNASVRKFIEETQPELVVCGHFHENAGKSDMIGKSLVINPGKDGRILEI
jgi:Icc-related predicted phosphoesterase